MESLEKTRSIVSATLGFIYFTCWSLSFYPQPLQNHSRRSISGTSIEMPIANLLGFACYTAYTASLLFSTEIRAQYAGRHPGNPIPAVSGWDFAFALHAVLLVALTLGQYLLWRGRRGAGEDERGRGAWGWVSAACVAGMLYVGGVAAAVVFKVEGWQWLDVVYAVARLKLFMTLVKYTPQVVLNWQRRSTDGWSIYTILLDFPGGVADVGQLLVDSGGDGHGVADGVRGNLVKLLIGLVSMSFDVIFIVQHFVLYRKGGKVVDDEPDEERPLLA